MPVVGRVQQLTRTPLPRPLPGTRIRHGRSSSWSQAGRSAAMLLALAKRHARTCPLQCWTPVPATARLSHPGGKTMPDRTPARAAACSAAAAPTPGGWLLRR